MTWGERGQKVRKKLSFMDDPLNSVNKKMNTSPFLVQVKYIHSEKATKLCKIFNLLLTVCTVVKVKTSQNFVAFSEYTYELYKKMRFNRL